MESVLTWKQRCWKDKFDQYQSHLKTIKKLEAEINKLLKKREKVPVVKDKVKSSMSEFPYVETHMVVDAYDPCKTQTIDRLIWNKQRIIEAYQAEIIEVEQYIDSIPDDLTREAFRLVFIEGMSRAAASEALHYSKDRVGQLIRAEFKKHKD